MFEFAAFDLDARNWEALEVVVLNAAPTANADTANAVEDGGPVSIDVLANDTDPNAGDTKTLVSVTNGASGAAVLVASNQALYDVAGLYQSLGAGQTATDTFSYVMRDSFGATSSASVTVTITGTNDGPVANTDTGAATEDGPAVSIDVMANDTDVDSGDTKTILSVSGGAAGTVVSTDGATVSYATGTAFQSLGAGATTTDTLTYVMVDSQGATSSATVTVTITGTNDGPVANADASAATEDGPAVTLDVLANDTDVDSGDTKTIVSVSGGAAGAVVSTDGATVSYATGTAFQSLAAGEITTDTLTYVMADSQGATSSASVTVTVTGTNDGPVANADTGAATEDGPAVSIDALANDTDVDSGGTKTILSVSGGGAGTVVSTDGATVSYSTGTGFQSLAQGDTTTDTLTYVMADGQGATSSATVAVTVTGTNDGPVANADTGAATEDGPAVALDVLANDTDVDAGDTKTILSVSGGAAGAVASTDGATISYAIGTAFQSLAGGQTATDTLSYVMADSQGATSSATVTVTITGVNDAPVANADAASVFEDGPAIGGNVLSNDSDADNRAMLTVTTTGVYVGAFGTLTLGASGGYSYAVNAAAQALDAGDTSFDSFDYTITDEDGATSSATITITIGGMNDGPMANADTAAAVEDGPAVTFDVLGNDTDVDADDGKTILSVSGGAAGTAVSTDGARVSYATGTAFQSLGAGQTATDTFTYVMADLEGATSSATVTVTITGTNDAPLANGDSATATEDGPAVIIDVLANDTDVDVGDTKTILSVSGGTAGTVVSTDGATISYSTGTAFQSLWESHARWETIDYVMADSQGATSSATVTLYVVGVNDAPVANDDAVSTNEDQTLLVTVATLGGNDTDVDVGDGKRMVSVGGAVNGTVSLSPLASLVTFTPSANYNGPASFTYVMRDTLGATASATVTVTVNPVNDAPVAVNDSASTNEDTALVVAASTLLANDTDVDAGDTKTLLSVGNAVNGTVSFGGGNVTFTPLANYSGPASFTYTMRDSTGATASATVSVTVNAVNDAPVAVDDSASTNEDTALVVAASTLLTNDTDVDAGDTKTLLSVGNAVNGTVSIGGSNVTFTPSPNYNGSASFTYTMRDSAGATASATVTVTVNPVNDAPVAVNDSASTNEDTALVVAASTLLANDTDVDAGDTKTLLSVGNAVNGTASFGGGNVTFTPNSNYSGPASFTYTMRDSAGATASATVSVTVNAVNDPPLAVNDDLVGTVGEGEWVFIHALANDRDPEGGSNTFLRITSVTGAPAGAIASIEPFSVSNDYISYYVGDRPLAAGQTAVDTLTYVVQDLGGATASATITLTVQGADPQDIVGSSGHDTLGGQGDDDSIVGSLGADTIYGRGGDDVIYGDGDLMSGLSSTALSVLNPSANTWVDGAGTVRTALFDPTPGTAGFGTASARADDASTFVSLAGTRFADMFKFGATTYSGFYVNTNGLLSFATGVPIYAGTAFPQVGPGPLLAAYWADVDTRSATGLVTTPGGSSAGSNLVYYDVNETTGVITVTWDDVGRYNINNTQLNAFQIQIVDRGTGAFDIVYRYEDVSWLRGSASPSDPSVGIDMGDGVNYYNAPGSRTSAVATFDTTPLPSVAVNAPAGYLAFQARDGALSDDNNDVIDGGLGNDTLFGDVGQDTVSYASATSGVTVNLALGTAQNTGGAGTDTLSGFERLSGSSYADTLSGDENDNVVLGLGGNDTISGGLGKDTLDGSAGHDSINAGGGNDTLIGGLGNDTLSGSTENDTFMFKDGDGQDAITDFAGGAGAGDVLDLVGVAGLSTFADVQARMSQVGADTVIDLNGTDEIRLVGVTATNLAADDVLV